MSGQPTELRATDDLGARLEEAEGMLSLMLEAYAAITSKEMINVAVFSDANLQAQLTVIHRLVLEAIESAGALAMIRSIGSSKGQIS